MNNEFDMIENGIYRPIYRWKYTIINNSEELELFYGFMHIKH